MKSGIYDISNAEYQATPAMSNSRLGLFHFDENWMEWLEKCPVDPDKMAALNFGDAMHAICLEPERLKSDFAVMPKFNLRSTAGKEEAAEWQAENSHKKIITQDEYKKMNLMFESVMAHPSARRLIEAEGGVEKSFFFTERTSGIQCKVRPDKYLPDFAIDLKTTADLKKFKFSVQDYRYYVQEPFYLDGMAECGVHADHMKFLVMQTTIELGRYPVTVVTLPEDVVEYGRKTYREDLKAYAKFLERKELKLSNELELHHWFINEIEEDFLDGIK